MTGVFIRVFMWVDCGSTWCMFSMYPVGVLLCHNVLLSGLVHFVDLCFVDFGVQ